MKKVFLYSLVFATLAFGNPDVSSGEMHKLAFPPKINVFRYSKSVSEQHLYGFPNVRIWGWSNNGKVAYSIERGVEGRGGQIINFVILDLVTDKTVFQQKMDSEEHNEATDEALYNLFASAISNALKTHDIIGQKTEFSLFPFKKDNTSYDCRIINTEYKKYEFAFDKVVTKYSVEVTANEKSKIIGNLSPVNTATGHVYVCGYFLSPFQNRALVIVAEEFWGFEGTELMYRFSGCHLGVGFN
jgi:hypothetical protein